MSKVVAIIPARAGSKRLPNKNKKLLNGKPMICYTLDEVIECYFIDEIIVSTNDKDIIEMIQLNDDIYSKIKIIERPEELCQDDTLMWEVIAQACAGIYNDYTPIILLQPTSPLRLEEDIKLAFDLFNEINYPYQCVVSVYKEDSLHYKLNGAIYIDYLETIMKNKGFETKQLYIMPKERSIDVDTIEDFNECERILKERDIK